MIKSKMTFVFNQTIYLCISVILFLLLIIQYSHVILVILIIYLIFIFIKDVKLFLMVLIIAIPFYLKIRYDYERIYTKLDENLVCEIISIPKYQNLKHQFFCRTNQQKILVEYKDEIFHNEFHIGETVEISGRVTFIKHNTIPNQFDFSSYYLSKQVSQKLTVEKIRVVKDIYKLHYKIIDTILNYYQDVAYHEYIYALLLGSRDNFDDDVTDSIQYLNISHLFVVSGFHVNVMFLILKTILKYLKITQEKSNMLSSVLLIGFMIVNLFATSIVRAVFFILLIQLKQKLHLNIANLSILALVCLIQILVNPFIIFNTGFQLTYLITAILLLSHELLATKKIKLFLVFKISLLAQLFSLPILSNFDFHFNFLSVLLSPILGLYYTFVIFPVSIFMAIFKHLDEYFKYFFILFEKVIIVLNDITIMNYNVGYFNHLRTLLYYLCLIVILIKIENKKRFFKTGFLFLFILFYYHSFNLVDEVTYLDVGQGDSALIKSDTKRCQALIDTGGIGSFSSSSYHPGERNVLPYLISKQIRTLDYLFISHSDEDHAGDYLYIIQNFKIKTIVLNQFDDSELSREIKQAALAKHINILEVNAYTKISCGEVELHVLNPMVNNNTSNDNSLVLFFVFNTEHFLFTGDVSQKVEEELIKNYSLTVDYLKVGHHGSKHSTSEAFLRHYMVKTGIISVGKNTYGHPTKEVLQTLEACQIKTYRTDQQGTISVIYYNSKKSIIKTYSPYNINALLVRH